jgi:hypothetical protein
VSDALRDALDELIPRSDEPRDWQELVRRSSTQTSRRRSLVLALAAAVAVAVSAPALGLHRDVVDFFSAEPAPEPVRFDFASLRHHPPSSAASPEWPFRDVIASEAREVTAVVVRGERRPLSVAPTASGGYCWHWYTMFNCRKEGEQRSGPLGVMRLGGDDQPWMLALSTQHAEVAQLELRYEDGERVMLPFVWVSEPIDAGFSIFEVPAEKSVLGHWPELVVALSSDGREVDRLDVLHPRGSARPQTPG